MAITVRRLTRRRDLGLSIVAGVEGADQVIDWAHAIELADPSPWLAGEQSCRVLQSGTQDCTSDTTPTNMAESYKLWGHIVPLG